MKADSTSNSVASRVDGRCRVRNDLLLSFLFCAITYPRNASLYLRTRDTRNWSKIGPSWLPHENRISAIYSKFFVMSKEFFVRDSFYMSKKNEPESGTPLQKGKFLSPFNYLKMICSILTLHDQVVTGPNRRKRVPATMRQQKTCFPWSL